MLQANSLNYICYTTVYLVSIVFGMDDDDAGRKFIESDDDENSQGKSSHPNISIQ